MLSTVYKLIVSHVFHTRAWIHMSAHSQPDTRENKRWNKHICVLFRQTMGPETQCFYNLCVPGLKGLRTQRWNCPVGNDYRMTYLFFYLGFQLHGFITFHICVRHDEFHLQNNGHPRNDINYNTNTNNTLICEKHTKIN